MRKFAILVATAVAAVLAALLVPANSSAATPPIFIGHGGTYIQQGNPSGTVTVSGGTIYARCSNSAISGTYGRPQCTTHGIACPATANTCTLTVGFTDATPAGVAWAYGGAYLYNFQTYTGSQILSQYNCPAQGACGERYQIFGVNGGAVAYGVVVNEARNAFPTAAVQVTWTVTS